MSPLRSEKPLAPKGKTSYQKPRLEPLQNYLLLTSQLISLPINP